MEKRIQNSLDEVEKAVSEMGPGDIPIWNKMNKQMSDTLKLIRNLQATDKKAGNVYVVAYNEMLSKLKAKLSVVQQQKKAKNTVKVSSRKKKKKIKKKDIKKAANTWMAVVDLDPASLEAVEQFEILIEKVDALDRQSYWEGEYNNIVKERDRIVKRYHDVFQDSLSKYGMRSERLMNVAKKVSNIVAVLNKKRILFQLSEEQVQTIKAFRDEHKECLTSFMQASDKWNDPSFAKEYVEKISKLVKSLEELKDVQSHPEIVKGLERGRNTQSFISFAIQRDTGDDGIKDPAQVRAKIAEIQKTFSFNPHRSSFALPENLNEQKLLEYIAMLNDAKEKYEEYSCFIKELASTKYGEPEIEGYPNPIADYISWFLQPGRCGIDDAINPLSENSPVYLWKRLGKLTTADSIPKFRYYSREFTLETIIDNKKKEQYLKYLEIWDLNFLKKETSEWTEMISSIKKKNTEIAKMKREAISSVEIPSPCPKQDEEDLKTAKEMLCKPNRKQFETLYIISEKKRVQEVVAHQETSEADGIVIEKVKEYPIEYDEMWIYTEDKVGEAAEASWFCLRSNVKSVPGDTSPGKWFVKHSIVRDL